MLRSVLKVTDASGVPVGDKAVLHENFQTLYRAEDIVWAGSEKEIWDQIRSFWIMFNDVPTPEDVKQSLERDFKADVKVVVDEIAVLPLMETASLRQHLMEYHETQSARTLLMAARTAMLIATQGQKVGKRELKGTQDAVNFLLAQSVPLIETRGQKKVGGDPRKDGEEMKERYLAAKRDPSRRVGILTGLEKIDEVTHGLFPGELVVIAAFQSEGKTTIMLNWAWNALVRQGFNVVIFSREMTYDQLKQALYVIHSSHPKFGDLHEPLDYDLVKTGRLDSDAEVFYLEHVIPDFQHCPDYGHIHIEPPSSDLTLTDVRVRSEYLNTQFQVDMICVDYLALCSGADIARPSDHKGETLNRIFIAAKQLALSFNQGAGVVVVTAHQCNRRGRDNAQENGGVYSTSALSDANECERCLSKYELVPTASGYKFLMDLKERVDSMGFSFGTRVIQEWHDSGYQRMLKIKNSRGRIILVSENTRIRVWDGMELNWKPAKTLTRGDLLVSALGYHLFGDGQVLLEQFSYFLWFLSQKSYTKPKNLTVELAWLFGYFAGNGYVVPNRGKVGFSLSASDKELVERIKGILSKYFRIIPQEKVSDRNTVDLIIHNLDLVHWVDINGLTGDAYAKHVPYFLWKASKDQVVAWLQGVWDAKGSVGKNQVEISMPNSNTIFGIQELLLNLGIDSRVYDYNSSSNQVDKPVETRFLHLQLWMKESLERAVQIGLFTLTSKLNALRDFVSRYQNISSTYEMTDLFMRELLRGKDLSCLPENIQERVRFWHRDGKVVNLSVRIAQELLTQFPELAIKLRPFAEMRWQFSEVVDVTDSEIVDCADITVAGDHEYQGPGVLLHNSSDVIVANYLDQDLRAMNEGKITMLKNREGKKVDPFNMHMRLSTRHIGNLADTEVPTDQLLDLEL